MFCKVGYLVYDQKSHYLVNLFDFSDIIHVGFDIIGLCSCLPPAPCDHAASLFFVLVSSAGRVIHCKPVPLVPKNKNLEISYHA